MPTLTIPRNFVEKDDLIIVSRKEYEALTESRKTAEFIPTAAQKRALAKAERNLKAGKTLSYNAISCKIGLRYV